MPLAPWSIILWTGAKHSGKTTCAVRLLQAVRTGQFLVAGCLAPSVYVDEALVGFDIVNLSSGDRTVLARRETIPSAGHRFRFTAEGLALGNEALSPAATKDADLIIVDEFGPLELACQGWRAAVDRLTASADAVLLLVVRNELADSVRQLYADSPVKRLEATEPDSVGEVLSMLRARSTAFVRQVDPSTLCSARFDE